MIFLSRVWYSIWRNMYKFLETLERIKEKFSIALGGAIGLLLPFLINKEISNIAIQNHLTDDFWKAFISIKLHILLILAISIIYFITCLLVYENYEGKTKKSQEGKIIIIPIFLLLCIAISIKLCPEICETANMLFYLILWTILWLGTFISLDRKRATAGEDDLEQLKLFHNEYLKFFEITVWASIFAFGGFSWQIFQVANETFKKLPSYNNLFQKPYSNILFLWNLRGFYLIIVLIFCMLIPMCDRLGEIRKKVRSK